jgi:hypothetical protein
VKIRTQVGVEAIVQAMGGHLGSEEVQRCGCVALSNLANNTDNTVKIRTEGGVPAHRGNEEVQRYGCGALSVLASSSTRSLYICIYICVCIYIQRER